MNYIQYCKNPSVPIDYLPDEQNFESLKDLLDYYIFNSFMCASLNDQEGKQKWDDMIDEFYKTYRIQELPLNLTSGVEVWDNTMFDLYNGMQSTPSDRLKFLENYDAALLKLLQDLIEKQKVLLENADLYVKNKRDDSTFLGKMRNALRDALLTEHGIHPATTLIDDLIEHDYMVGNYDAAKDKVKSHAKAIGTGALAGYTLGNIFLPEIATGASAGWLSGASNAGKIGKGLWGGIKGFGRGLASTFNNLFMPSGWARNASPIVSQFAGKASPYIIDGLNLAGAVGDTGLLTKWGIEGAKSIYDNYENLGSDDYDYWDFGGDLLGASFLLGTRGRIKNIMNTPISKETYKGLSNYYEKMASKYHNSNPRRITTLPPASITMLYNPASNVYEAPSVLSEPLKLNPWNSSAIK